MPTKPKKERNFVFLGYTENWEVRAEHKNGEWLPLYGEIVKKGNARKKKFYLYHNGTRFSGSHDFKVLAQYYTRDLAQVDELARRFRAERDALKEQPVDNEDLFA